MVATDAKAYLPIGLEAAAGGQEAEGWRAQWIGRRKDDSTVIYATFIRGGRRALDCKVPFKEVRLERRGSVF